MTEWQTMEKIPEGRYLIFKSKHEGVAVFGGKYFCVEENLKNGMVLVKRYIVPDQNKNVKIDYRHVNGWMEPPK